jgi:predicted GH43/DUF377 family glycosyl hydrolase
MNPPTPTRAAIRSPGGWPRAAAIPLLDPVRASVGIPFIVETGHESFNPSLIRWNGDLIMAWREGWERAVIWIGRLDSEFIVGLPIKVDLHLWNLGSNPAFEDPRLFLWRNQLHVSFTILAFGRVRMAMVRLNEEFQAFDLRIFEISDPKMEKNWQFFEHQEELHAVYLVNPHLVGRICGNQVEFPRKTTPLPWMDGEARGGSPPVKIGAEYFSFFHSSCCGNYVAGVYAFEAKPPFRITRWPQEPCLVADRDKWRTWGGRIVFPAGAIFEDGLWTVSFGWHDTHCCLARYRHEDLLSTLTPPAFANTKESGSSKSFRIIPVTKFDALAHNGASPPKNQRPPR